MASLHDLHPEQKQVEPCVICGHMPKMISRGSGVDEEHAVRCGRHARIVGTGFIKKHRSVAIARWNIGQLRMKHMLKGQFKETASGVRLREKLFKRKKNKP